ncbi:MAG TPA: hypothetical protein VFL14_16765, partial [Xanthomonadales bacterium]|nr:hypothetical protein [Xanthomonadales bacterium]
MTRAERTARTAMLALTLLVFADVAAAATSWRTEIARGGVGGFGDAYWPGGVYPSPDGFWLTGYSYGATWIAHHARDGTRIALQRLDARTGYASMDSRGNLVVRYGPGDWGFEEYIDQCRVERGATGAPRSVVSLDSGAPDGGDGVIEAGTIIGLEIRSTDLYRVQRDCRKAALPAIGREEIVGVRNDPAAVAAYVLARDADGGNAEIVRIDRERVVWRLPLAQTAGPYDLFELGVADEAGVGLRWSDNAAGCAYCIARVTVDGRLAWQRRLASTNTGLVSWNPAPLLAHFDGGYATRFEALDRDTGETRFSVAPPMSLRWPEPLRTARPDGGWRIAGNLGDQAPAVLLDVHADGRIVVRWTSDDDTHRARAELADGSVLLSRSRDFNLSDWSLVAADVKQGPGRPLADAGRAPIMREPQFVVAGPDGALLTGWHEGLRAYVARVERDGRLAWTAELPPADSWPTVRVVAGATDGVLACALVQRPLSDRMRCFDARTGAVAFDVEIDGLESNWRVGLFADGVHLVDTRVTFADLERTDVPRLRVFDGSGRLRLQRELPLDRPYDRLSAFGTSGEFVATSSSGTVRAFAPDGTLRWTIDGYRGQTARIARDGGALLVDLEFTDTTVRRTLRGIGADGQQRWSREFEGASLDALGADWLVRDAGSIRRISGVDGSDRWVVPRGELGLVRATAPDGSAYTDGTGWYDGGDGARIGVVAGLPNVVPSALYRFDANGRLVRLAAQLDGTGSTLALEHFAPDRGTGPRARLAATGFWQDASVPGQGIALVVDSRSGAVEGRWLTFDQTGATRIDAQRWYRLAGRAPLDGDALALAIEAPQP